MAIENQTLYELGWRFTISPYQTAGRPIIHVHKGDDMRGSFLIDEDEKSDIAALITIIKELKVSVSSDDDKTD